jgi:hypothetical protein
VIQHEASTHYDAVPEVEADLDARGWLTIRFMVHGRRADQWVAYVDIGQAAGITALHGRIVAALTAAAADSPLPVALEVGRLLTGDPNDLRLVADLLSDYAAARHGTELLSRLHALAGRLHALAGDLPPAPHLRAVPGAPADRSAADREEEQ